MGSLAELSYTLGFRVEGLGFVDGFIGRRCRLRFNRPLFANCPNSPGFRVWGLGFRAWGLGFRV